MGLEFVYDWLEFADMDLATAEYIQGMRPQPLEIICYHCQQSAEKYLKGYLAYKNVIPPPKIHDLDDLCEKCFEYDECFRIIKRACNVLTRYSVQPRYPNEMEITENNMKKALEYARQIKNSEPILKLRRKKSE